MGVYIKGITKKDALRWLHYQMPFSLCINDNDIIEVAEPHGDLKDFDKVTSYKICGIIDCDNRKTSNATGRVILDKDWQNAPTLIEAEE